MEQIAVYFSSGGVPALGLSPIIDIRERNGTKIINDGKLYELAGGWYIYNFDSYNNDKVYLYTFDGGSSLSDSDRYKAGGNELDAYSNKYSRGRTAIPATNYMPNFQKLEKQIKTQKFPTYDDSTLKQELKLLRNILDSKTDDGVLSQIANLQKQIGAVRENMDLTSQNSTMKLQEEVTNLMSGLADLKENMGNYIKETEGNVATKLDEIHGNISKSMEEKLHPDYLSTHISKPVSELQRRVEDLFIAQVQKNVPDHILNQFDIKLIKKDDTAALKELEAMIKEE